MKSGYVLDFSNYTFENFVSESVRKEIYSGKYENDTNSKAKVLRNFWQVESNNLVSQLISDLIEYWKTNKQISYLKITEEHTLLDECIRIASKLKQESVVEDIEVINEESGEYDFQLLSKQVKELIIKNKPEAGLDRRHTYMMKYIRMLCQKHSIPLAKEESLNAMYGKYIKSLRENGVIVSLPPLLGQ